MEVRVLLAAPIFALRASPGTAGKDLRAKTVRRSAAKTDRRLIYYVYILRSVSLPGETYTGITEDLRRRLSDRNSGKSPHTSKYMPWTIACYFAFPGKSTAYAFESYLKSHSGRIFARKRLLGD